ncbi:MAG: BatA and WFA domain-containing protein [Proteobacteria bacterium]|nr:BatA and WFA domain-containing protein [Pseudomonadota bacterium]
MGLETPLALMGLAAMAIPFLIHRMRQRELPRQPLPSIALLRLAHQSQRRKRRLSDLALLASRLSLLALACVAVGGPFVLRHVAWGQGEVVSLALVLDNSLSMQRPGSDGSLLDGAVARARAVVRSLPEGSQVALVAAAQPARIVVGRTSNLALALDALSPERLVTHAGTDLPRAVEMARRQLASARHGDRRMLILSDFAKHTRPERIAWPGDGTTVEFERLRPMASDLGNLWVEDARAAEDPSVPNRVSVAFEVRGQGRLAASFDALLMYEERTLAKAHLTLVHSRAKGILHASLPEMGGNPAAQLVLDVDDALAQDNQRAILLRDSQALQVTIINGDPRPNSPDDELRFLARALASADPGLLSYRILDAPALAAHSLAATDVVVLANAPAPLLETARQLERFVRRGGGLLVTAGPNFEPARYQERLPDLLAARPVQIAGGAQRGLRLGSHAPPRFRDLSGLARIETHRRLVLEDQDGETALSFPDRSPALVFSNVGRGRVALLATSIDDDWTDLPYRPGFLPLMLEVLRSLARLPMVHSRPVSPQSSVELTIPPGANLLEITAPDGSKTEFRAQEHPDDRVGFTGTRLAGAYRIRSADNTALRAWPRAAFVVAPPPAESDLTPGDVPVSDSGPARSASAGSQQVARRPLASMLFLLAGLAAALEGWLRLGHANALSRKVSRAAAERAL